MVKDDQSEGQGVATFSAQVSANELDRLTRHRRGTKPASVRRKDCIICAERRRADSFAKATLHCSHPLEVCKECITRYLEEQINENGRAGDNVLCPSLDCGASFDDSDVRRFFDAGDPILIKYERRGFEQALECDSNFRWCPQPGCPNGQLIDDVSASSFWTCGACYTRVCILHRTVFHDGLTCAQYDARGRHVSKLHGLLRFFVPWGSRRPSFQLFRRPPEEDEEARAKREAALLVKQEAASLKTMRKMGAKRCPKCGCPLVRDGGCAHFTCGTRLGCGYEWCWLCLADYDEIRQKGNSCHKGFCRFYA